MTADIRAITVKQPWAWAIAHGGKTIENRSRGVSYRGPLLIHAGAAWSARGDRDERVVAAWRAAGLSCVVGRIDRNGGSVSWVSVVPGPRATQPPSPVPPLSAIVAVAQLVDSHPDAGCCQPWGDSSYAEVPGHAQTAVHHLVLDDVVALAEPVPCRGALGLWRPPADVVLQCGGATVSGAA